MYLNALKCVFPHSNKIISELINQMYRRLFSINQTGKVSLLDYSQALSYMWNQMSEKEMRSAGLKNEYIERLIFARRDVNPERELSLLLAKNIRLINQHDEAYPEPLKEIHDPPILLYVKGNAAILGRMHIAVVGTRTPSPYGKEMTERIVREMAPYDICVVSGLAYGIDTYAHAAAVDANIPTIAVLGSGLGELEARSASKLIHSLMEDNLVVTEYPYDVAAAKHTFPMRNRIIAGLSKAVVVVEARERSGALITAYSARSENREVFAVPGSLLSDRSRGPYKLMENKSAHVFLSVRCMMEDLGIQPREYFETAREHSRLIASQCSMEEIEIYKSLERPLSVDDIVELLKLPVS